MTNRKKLLESFIPPPASFSSNFDKGKNRFRKSMEKGGGGYCHTVPLLVGATDEIVARTSDGNAIFMNVRKAIQHVT